MDFLIDALILMYIDFPTILIRLMVYRSVMNLDTLFPFENVSRGRGYYTFFFVTIRFCLSFLPMSFSTKSGFIVKGSISV